MKKSYFQILLILFFIASNKNLHALDFGQNIINNQDWIIRQQQNKIEEDKRNQEQEKIESEYNYEKNRIKKNISKIEISNQFNLCVKINEIMLIDANLISQKQQEKLTQDFIGKCFEAKILSDLIARLNAYYHNLGYITTQIIVPKQNIHDGILELQIIEGKIEKISLGKNDFFDAMQKFTAFGFYKNNLLNVDEINQGIYQINRLRSNQAIMKIQPGSQDGLSEIVIENNKKFPAFFEIGRDNLGNDFTGVKRTKFASSIDNLLSLNDNLNLNYTTNLNDDSQKKDLKSFASSLSIPFKYNTFYYDYSYSEFKGQIQQRNQLHSLTGFSQSRKITIDRTLSNQAKLRIALNASLANKESASYLDGDKNSNSQRRLSIFNFGFSFSSYLNDNTNLYLKPSFSRGLEILNATKDQSNSLSSTPKAQFELFKLYGLFSKKFLLIDIPLNFSSEFDGQFSKHTLYGSEQISSGGYYSVRGFRENYITGDSGYNLRNKINIKLGSFIKENKTKNYLNKIKLEPFYDYGYVRNKYDGSGGRLSGAGLKTIFENKYFNASLTYSWAINKSSLINSEVKENKIIYFEISANCCD